MSKSSEQPHFSRTTENSRHRDQPWAAATMIERRSRVVGSVANSLVDCVDGAGAARWSKSSSGANSAVRTVRQLGGTSDLIDWRVVLAHNLKRPLLGIRDHSLGVWIPYGHEKNRSFISL